MKKLMMPSLAILLIFSFLVSAAPSDIIEDKTGINPQDLSAEQLKEDYLKQNWAEIIQNNAILGPFNNFFTKISPLFSILFGQPYSLSPRLFFIILLWIYVITKIDSALYALGFLNRPAQVAIAIGSGIILAQLHALSLIVAALAELISSQEMWWMRVVMILISAVILFVLHFIINKGIFAIKQTKKGKQAEMEKNRVGQVWEFLKGVKEGQKLES